MRRERIAFLVLLAVLLWIPVGAPQFQVTLANYIGLYSIVALGLVLLLVTTVSFGVRNRARLFEPI